MNCTALNIQEKLHAEKASREIAKTLATDRRILSEQRKKILKLCNLRHINIFICAKMFQRQKPRLWNDYTTCELKIGSWTRWICFGSRSQNKLSQFSYEFNKESK